MAQLVVSVARRRSDCASPEGAKLSRRRPHSDGGRAGPSPVTRATTGLAAGGAKVRRSQGKACSEGVSA
ncbi:MAG: hypothetical protein IPN01_10330 [Deltaproteobacteria bacterium]|nr:hypothetical protein [Deltaproteobacteria bacterium]